MAASGNQPPGIFRPTVSGEASSKVDRLVIEKFMHPNAVTKMKCEIAQAQKAGLDFRNLMLEMEPGEAFWSEEHSAWFVNVRLSHVKKWNLALRGRWMAGCDRHD